MHVTFENKINYDIIVEEKVILRASVWEAIMVEFEWWLLENVIRDEDIGWKVIKM